MIEHTPYPWIANEFDVLHRPTQFNGKPLRDLPIVGVAESRGAIPEDDHVAEANTRLMAIAPTAPHECSDRDCPGNVNRRKIAACASLFCAAVKLLAEYDYGTAMASALHGNVVATELLDNLRAEVGKALQ